MKKLLLVLSLCSLFLIVPVTNGAGFEHIDNINEGISVFFLTHLNSSECIEVNVTHLEDGNFTLFLFDSRPIESFINPDKSLDYHIFDNAINYSTEENPYLFHNASESKIYYIELILLDSGPDTFFLYCNKELTRYYLPIIPGFSLEITFLSILLTCLLIIFFRKKLILYPYK